MLQGPVSFGDPYAQFTLSSVYSVLSVDESGVGDRGVEVDAAEY